MSLGVLGGKVIGLVAAPRRALGASVIPGRCWDKPGFKACHAKLWKQSQAECAADGAPDFDGNVGKCIEVMTDSYAFVECIPQLCPEEKPRGTVQVGPIFASGDDCNSANTIKFVQWVVGTPVDGKWGKDSRTAYDKYNAETGKDYYAVAQGCVGTGPVARPVTIVAPPPVVIPEAFPVAPTPKVSKAAVFAGVGILAALGTAGYYYGQKKGWFG